MRASLISIIVLTPLLLLGACSTSSDDNNDKKNSPASIDIAGASGDKVDMNGDWSRGCGDSDGVAESDLRTLSGEDMTLVFSSFVASPDCSGDRDWHTEYVATITSDQTVTITDWVDNDGARADPPTGLEEVPESNGVTLNFTSGTITPDTAAGADALNTFEDGYCAITDWAVDVEEDVMECQFGTSTVELLASWVVDDTVADVAIYEGNDDEDAPVDADGYPTDVFNAYPLIKQ